mgnify:FL=1
MYQIIDNKTEERIEQIIEGDYLSTALGTIDNDNYPLVTKIIPMHFNKITYLLMSDLSEHTKNICTNNKVCIYFFLREEKKQKANNVRLSITGKLKKLDYNKNSKEFILLMKQYENIEIGSKLWGNFTDFNFYSFQPLKLLYIEGFGKAYNKIY